METRSSAGHASVAFLILAHHEPALLGRLVARLDAPWSRSFIHLDAHCDADPFRAAVPATARFIPDRLRIHWGGFSMVAATLRLLRTALDDGTGYQRFVLLSGADYPVRPLAAIREVLARDTDFIQIDRRIDPAGRTHFDRCLNRRFLGDNALLTPRSTIPVLPALARRAERLWPHPLPAGLVAYYGPSWWALTRRTALRLLACVDREPDLVRWFAASRAPDESFFQTLIRRECPDRTPEFDYTTSTPDPAATANMHCLHYVDWQNPNPVLPRTLDLEDLDAIAATPALFARKMSSARSLPLLDALDTMARYVTPRHLRVAARGTAQPAG